MIPNLMNEALIYQLNKVGKNKIRDIMDKMPKDKDGKYLIDQSTVGLHLTGVRRAGLDHIFIYAEIINAHPWRLLDDYVCKYPVVGNVNAHGIVEPRDKFQNDYLVSNNDLWYIENTLVVLSKSKKLAYLYNEGTELNFRNLNLEEPQRCLIVTKSQEIMGFLTDVDFDTKKAKYFLLKSNSKTVTIDFKKIYPINETKYLNTLADDVAVIEHTFHKPKLYKKVENI